MSIRPNTVIPENILNMEINELSNLIKKSFDIMLDEMLER